MTPSLSAYTTGQSVTCSLYHYTCTVSCMKSETQLTYFGSVWQRRFASIRYLGGATVKNSLIVCKKKTRTVACPLFALRTPYSSIFETDTRFVFIIKVYPVVYQCFITKLQIASVYFINELASLSTDKKRSLDQTLLLARFTEIPKINSQTKPGPVNAPFRYFLDV